MLRDGLFVTCPWKDSVCAPKRLAPPTEPHGLSLEPMYQPDLRHLIFETFLSFTKSALVASSFILPERKNLQHGV